MERQRPGPVGLEPAAGGPPRQQRQDCVESIEGLIRRLPVDAEGHNVPRRLEIRADHIRRFRLALKIGRPQVPFKPMRLQAGLVPGARNNPLLHHSGCGRAIAWTSGLFRGAAGGDGMMRASRAGVSTVAFKP